MCKLVFVCVFMPPTNLYVDPEKQRQLQIRRPLCAWKGVKSFLQTCFWYRRYIENSSCSPSEQTTKKWRVDRHPKSLLERNF